MASRPAPPRRLPARVYWFRRALVLGTAMAVVFGIAQVLGGSDPGPQTAATTTAAEPSVVPSPAPQGPVPSKTGGPAPKKAAVPLAEPDGPCAADQITVTPDVAKVTAGRAITLRFHLTGIKPACTFAVSSRSLVAKVVVGPKRIWSTQQCPATVKRRTVVVRNSAPTDVTITWNGRYSDGGCSSNAPWALPGSYRLIAAAIGSEPSEDKFRLVAPERPVVIKTVTPTPKPKAVGTPTATVNAGP